MSDVAGSWAKSTTVSNFTVHATLTIKGDSGFIGQTSSYVYASNVLDERHQHTRFQYMQIRAKGSVADRHNFTEA